MGKGTLTLIVPMSPFATSWRWAVLDLVWGGEGGFRPDKGVPVGELWVEVGSGAEAGG